MAKILVADDNSNIQRMVGLALKDQGIDVVAVGNGEAAVRKISEIRPDLVLADVFMPVRNGYEVCQYVKEDPLLKHIPVILLVGAFDPLDEQEAQRVGADGVLKKPFVPPDPLIVMVKSALQRAGVSLDQGAREKTPVATPRKPADVLPFSPPTVPAGVPPADQTPRSPLGGLSFSRRSTPEPIVIGDEKFVETSTASEPVRIDTAEQTMAFGELLGPPTAEETEFASTYVAEKTNTDWSDLEEPTEVPEEEEEESRESGPSWRREEATTSAFRGDDESGPVKDWRDSPMLQTTGRKSARETWEQTEEKGGFVTAAEVPTDMGAFVSEIGALEGESLNAKKEEANAPQARVEEEPQTGFSQQTETFSSDEGAIAVAEESEFSRESASQQGTGNASTVSEVANEAISEPLPEIAQLEETARLQEITRQEEAAREEQLARQQEIARQEEATRLEEVARLAEIARREEAARQEEIARREEAARQEEIARREEAARQEEIARREEAARQEEIARQQEAERQQVIARLEEVARQKEAARQEEVARQEDTARQEEIARREEAARQEDIARQQEKRIEPEPVNSWFSRPASPWDSDTKRSNPWAAALESAKPAATDEVETGSTATNSDSNSSGVGGDDSSDALATVISDLSAAEVTSTHPTASQAEVDAMVAKVLSKLSPEVMQAVTRELLKPVIASLVQDELKSKK